MEAHASPLRPLTDGVVTIRPFEEGDQARLIAGRDDESRRWLGPNGPGGNDDPRPTACIIVGGEMVGWVDYETDRDWLKPGEVNVGYSVFAPHRGNGYATRAVELLMEYLAECTSFHTASLSINSENARSLAVAARLGFELGGEAEAAVLDFKRPVRPGTRA